jgi:hypothetical protein
MVLTCKAFSLDIGFSGVIEMADNERNRSLAGFGGVYRTTTTSFKLASGGSYQCEESL